MAGSPQENKQPLGYFVSLDFDDRERETEAQLTVDLDLDCINTVFMKLEAPEDVDICGMGFQCRELKLNLARRNRRIILWR